MDWSLLKKMPMSQLEDIVTMSNNKAVKLYRSGHYAEALKVIRPIMDVVDLTFQNVENRKVMKQDLSLDKVCGLIADIYGAIGDSTNAQKFYEYYHFLAMQLKHPFRDEKNVKVFQFRRFTEYSLSNLLNREITLSHPKVMNDITDTLIFTRFKSPSFGKTCYDRNHLPYFERSHDDYRIASFCMDNPIGDTSAVSNALMWAHYANEHSGFCIEYEFSHNEFMRNNIKERIASRLLNIKYALNDKPFNVEEKEPFTVSDAFLTKSADWKYENEVRLIQYKPAGGALRQQYRLDPETKVSAIYFGVRCPDTTISIIKKLVSDNIPTYKMRVDYKDVFTLKYDAI